MHKSASYAIHLGASPCGTAFIRSNLLSAILSFFSASHRPHTPATIFNSLLIHLSVHVYNDLFLKKGISWRRFHYNQRIFTQ